MRRTRDPQNRPRSRDRSPAHDSASRAARNSSVKRVDKLARRRERSRRRARALGAAFGILGVVGSLVLGTAMIVGSMNEQRASAATTDVGAKSARSRPSAAKKPAPPSFTPAARTASSKSVRKAVVAAVARSSTGLEAVQYATSGTPEAVSAAALRYPDAPSVERESIRSLKPRHKYVAITVDDGLPFNESILDVFEQNHVRCTTFLLGQVASERPDLVKRMHKDGFEIANHTWDHAWLTKKSDGEIRRQLSKTQDAISAVTGNQAPYMRPPYGAMDDRVSSIAAEMGYRVVLWNRSFADTSSQATADSSYSNVMNGLEAGDIILCHWGKESSHQALKRILPELKRRGFTAVTVSELLADCEPEGSSATQ